MVLLSRSRTITALRVVWTVLTFWFEYGVFWYAVRKCEWPDHRFRSTFTTTRPTHVLVVADPQILDWRSYPGRPAILTKISQVLVDLNIRKNWREATRLKPDAVVFLGDMMDSGRFTMPDAEYEAYHNRFKSIFTLERNVPQYFIPGNHDIGLRLPAAQSQKARERYRAHFGPLNRHVTLAEHNLIFLDTLGLAEEDYVRDRNRSPYADWRPAPGGTVHFVETIADVIKPPVILFSHIPLYRPDNTDCGPLRERGTIQEGFGESYQNVLSQEATNFLLRELKPTLVLSGDDHDYCEFNHTLKLPSNSVHAREVTVKSLSMAMNVRRPGFQLLSLWPRQYWKHEVTTTYADELCLLPDQISIYLSTYLPMLLISMLIVVLVNLNHSRKHSTSKENGAGAAGPSFQLRTAMLKQRSSSLRNEDRDEEEATDDHHDHPSLPSPASATRSRHLPRYSWSFVFLGRRRRITIPEPHRPTTKAIFRIIPSISGSFGVHNLKHRGFFRNSVHDVGLIALFPLATMVLISLWAMIF